ncbi:MULTISPECIES: cytochrome d ubiquinol oxidase subunit II [Pseudomonadota]|jgi:cytochrome d ubiquinol oxidase subunit II|uniref:cytochrome d ubiquinol oxidase subunit II n=1 Tax=Pseudomonadota TaxID=1224 RepID=UPI000769FA42|nr:MULTISPECIES: cytochrome d ubiquinol oxidase subunit II [Pseudomonadota]MAF61826.1 cytochrome d ubiquinol oxidase subunit II [Blastomonas sp.]MBA4780250.1 cytochrome d ubiquinol oxidase subunit II [Blastomonas sp.]|tara:strand:+ start:64679 stop:65680 length:1002 start_codon:yes stop_codon:yes gene_type:complete
MNIDLTIVWAFVIAFAVFAYVVMDGFDLGIGIIFPALGRGAERDKAMNSVAPVWDGNETWLVLGGGGLLAAFPLAYAIILPAIYPPIIAMLLGLVLRGVAFEGRWRDPNHQPFWDFAFTAGSFVAAFAQGVTLGALLQGVEVEGRAYAGGWLDWLSAYSVLTGIGTVIGYGLLGSTWLLMKTEGAVQDHAFRMSWKLFPATLVALGAVSLYTPFLEAEYFARWFTFPSVLFSAQVPLLVAVISFLLFRSLQKRHDYAPFLLTLGLFLLGMIGLGISMFPYVVPDEVTIWDAATHPSSQAFMLVGTLFIVPLIIGYTAWAYWVFRGKVGDEGYH